MKRIIAFMLLLVLCLTFTACGNSEDETSIQFIIAGKDTTEQLIVDQMLLLLLEAKTDHAAVVTTNSYLTSADLAEATQEGKLHLYVDYNGSMYENVLGLDLAEAKGQSITDLVRDTYKTEYALKVKDAIGFSGGYVVYITDEELEALGNPEDLSDLVEASDGLVVGMEQSFYERADAFDAFASAYGFTFKATQTYGEQEGFAALMDGDVDLFIGEATSPYYSLFDLNTLNDDEEFFHQAAALPVVSAEVLAEYPEVADAINMTKKLISTKTMSSLVAKVELEGKQIGDVARDFLRARSMI